MQLDKISQQTLVESIAGIFNKIMPEVVYLPFKGDVHSDHRIVFNAAFSCTKSFRYPSVKKILMMETISETEFAPSLVETAFIPNVFSDVSDVFHRKIEIIQQHYGTEIGEHPFPRSIENMTALALFRGATAGCRFSEAFMLLRENI